LRSGVMTNPAVTVVVVSYQTRDLLRRCLTSLHQPAAAGFAKVVVVDNGSTDGSPEVVRDQFPWSELITGFGNIGFGAAVNLGARDCSTPWLIASNADIELPPDALWRLVDVGDDHPSAGAFAPKLVLPGGETQRSVYRFTRASDRLISICGGHRLSRALARRVDMASCPPTSGDVDWAVGAFLLFRTQAFQAVGGFDERLWMYAEDMDICWRLSRGGWSTRYVAEVPVRHTGEGAVGIAFGGRSQTLKLAAHYAWLEARFGWPIMFADVSAELLGALTRQAMLWILQRLWPRRWSDAYHRVAKWRAANLEALRIRQTTRNPAGAGALSSSPREPWPTDGLEPLLHCPLCQAAERTRLYAGLTDRMAWPTRGTWTMWECSECHGAYLDPRPSQATIGLAYARSYYTHRPRPTPPPDLKGRLRTRVRHGYLNRALGYELSPASSAGGAVLAVFGRRAELSASSVRHLSFRRGGRVLDVGAGAGEFVALMRDAGWNAEGIDPDPGAVDAARLRDIPVTCSTVDEILAQGSEHMYDAITLNHVIEHLHDPAHVLEVCHRLLKPSGVIWIATPNLDSIGHQRFGRHWVHLDPPRHLVLFTRAALEAALAAAGFVDARSLLSRSTRPLWTFRASAAIARREARLGPWPLAAGSRIVLRARLALQLHPECTEEIAITARPLTDERRRSAADDRRLRTLGGFGHDWVALAAEGPRTR
jgi:GT2 family glycosyltransferase/2-polyprenyl-3-methyl-5-hydroxy-6-metoxy-1,4-benzoquinol methylase